jgi:hypothetical protein
VRLENKRSCKVHEAGWLYIHSKVYNDHCRKVSVPLLRGRVPQRALCDGTPKTCCWGPPARRPPSQRWSAASHGVRGVGAAAPQRRPSGGPAATVVGVGRPLRGRLLGPARAAPAPPALPWSEQRWRGRGAPWRLPCRGAALLGSWELSASWPRPRASASHKNNCKHLVHICNHHSGLRPARGRAAEANRNLFSPWRLRARRRSCDSAQRWAYSDSASRLWRGTPHCARC